MIITTKELKELRKAIIIEKRKQYEREYWNKIAIKEEGYVIARKMEIECIKLANKEKIKQKNL